MKSFKLMLSLMGAIAAAAITVTPLAAFAQTPQSQQSQEAPIELDQAQRTKFDQLQVEAIAQIEKVLTEQQRNQFAAGRENGRGFREVQNLTDPQKSQILAILEKFNDQIEQLLTAEQKEKIRQFQERSQQNQRKQR